MNPSSPPISDPIYLAYLAVFAAAAAGCLFGTWRAYRRQAGPPGVRRGLTCLLGSSGLWALSHVGVLLSPSLGLKTVFYEAGLIVGFGTVWAWLWFCSSYSGRSLHKKKAARWAALAVFGAVTLTKLTNPWHGLYFTAEWAAVPFGHLAVDYHIIYWITTSLSYALAGVGFFMLAEPLRRAQVGSGKLAGLFGLMALPIGANAVGYTTPYLLGLSHEPIGVAAFSIGVLFVLRNRFEETGQAGRTGKPVLVLSEGDQIQNCQIKNCNEAAAERFPALRRGGAAGTAAVGTALGDVLPRLAEVLGGPDKTRQDEILELEGSEGETRYFRAAESRFRQGAGQAVILTDVTERELRREKREARLEAIAANVPGVAFEFRAGPGEERSVEFVSEEVESMLGLSADPEGFYERFAGRIPEGHRESFFESVEEAIETQARWRHEFPIERPGGERVWLLGSAEPENEGPENEGSGDEGGHVSSRQMLFRGVLLDITERKRAERQREQERDRLETLFESLPTPVVRCRAEGRGLVITDANPAFEETFASDGEEAEGKDLNDLVVPEGRRGEAAEIDDRALKESPVETEVRRAAANGPRDFRLQVAGRRPEEGPAEIYATYTDITERKEAERRRKQVIRRVTDGIVEVDSEWRFTLVNEQAEEIYGLDREEMLGKSLWEVFPGLEGTEFEEVYREAMEAREPTHVEEYFSGLGGWFDVQVYPGEDGGLAFYFKDITERKEREEALRRQEERLRSITENVSDGIYRSTPEEGIVYANSAFVEMFGYESLEELRAADPSGFYDDPAEREALYRREAEQGGLDGAEVRFRRKDGTTFFGLLSTEQVEGPDGETAYYDGAIADITERREARQRLERQREYTDRLLGAIEDLFFVLDEKARLRRWNGRVPEVTGYSEEELGGMEALDLVPEGERERVAARIADGFTAGRAQIEIPLLRSDGTTVPYEIVGNLVEHPEGGLRVVGIARDVTKRKRRKRKLERQNDLFERAQQIASVGAWEYDVQKEESMLTDQAYRIHGLPPGSDMSPEKTLGFFHAEDRPAIRQAFTRAIKEGKAYDIEARLITEEGEERWIRTRGEPQREDGSPEGKVARVRGTIQDITERKRRERGLREAKEKAEKSRREAEKAKEEAENASQMKSSLLANMSHEIRTPLTSIIGFAEALGAESAELELPEGSALPKYASLIEKGGKRLLQTLNGVLNLSKLEAGQMELSSEAVGLATEAERTAEELRPEAKEKGIDLRLETREAGARADEGGVQIVLRNLLSNAIKYTGEGGTVWVRTYREEDADLPGRRAGRPGGRRHRDRDGAGGGGGSVRAVPAGLRRI